MVLVGRRRRGCSYCGRKCSGSGKVYEYDKSLVEHIMVRFRPIAPKPVSNNGSVSGPRTSKISVKKPRVKRRYSVRRMNTKKHIEKKGDVVTLSLLPETPERKETATPQDQMVIVKPKAYPSCSVSDLTSHATRSCVIVECVTDTSVDMEKLGLTDVKRRMNLERDTCPGFISDCYNRVKWMNEAYRIMVGCHHGCDDGWPEMVWLVMKEDQLPRIGPAFSCRVRLQYKEKKSVIVPCDVWRMDCGDLAWRLDMQAVLSLGR